MSKIYIIFYDDEEGGSRENWNTFYTPFRVFTTAEKRATFKAALKAASPDLGFHEVEVEIDNEVVDKEKLSELVGYGEEEEEDDGLPDPTELSDEDRLDQHLDDLERGN